MLVWDVEGFSRPRNIDLTLMFSIQVVKIVADVGQGVLKA